VTFHVSYLMTTLRRWLSDGRWLWALGGGSLFWHALHSLDHPAAYDSLPTALFGVLGPSAASLFVLGLGVVVGRRWGPESLRGVGRWTLVGAAGLTLVGLLTVAYFRTNGVALPEWVHFVLNATTGGAAGGALVGVYDERASRVAANLRRERRRAGLLNQRLRVLNRVLRHDLRNDMNVVQGYASLLEADDDLEVAARAETIRRTAEELTSLGERARHLERLLGDETAEERTDLAAVVERRLDAFEREYPHAQVRVDVPDRAPVGPVPLVGVVVDVLVENAVVHNDRDEPMVSVDVRTGEDRVVLRVADDGPGIPESERAVFESGTETPLRHSEGLGLWVVEWAVDEAGGRLALRDRSVGTVVVVALPRVDPSAATATDAARDAVSVADRWRPSLQPFGGGPE
jgi:signal transduction histidine kinase